MSAKGRSGHGIQHDDYWAVRRIRAVVIELLGC